MIMTATSSLDIRLLCFNVGIEIPWAKQIAPSLHQDEERKAKEMLEFTTASKSALLSLYSTDLVQSLIEKQRTPFTLPSPLLSSVYPYFYPQYVSCRIAELI